MVDLPDDERRLTADGGDAAPGRRADVRLPETADDEEAAAIAAAIGTYLADERAAAEAGAGGDGRSWDGRRWSFAGRLDNLTGRAARVPDGAPADGWSAAGRADRY